MLKDSVIVIYEQVIFIEYLKQNYLELNIYIYYTLLVLFKYNELDYCLFYKKNSISNKN